MRLIPVANVITSLGFDDMPDINAAASAALEQTTLWLESKFDTNFSRANWTERFFVPEHMRASVNNPPNLRLRLSNGFVVPYSQETRAVEYWGDIDNAPAITAMQPLTPNGLTRGILQDVETWYGTTSGFRARQISQYQGPLIRVTYQAGFEADGTDPDMYDQSQVPDSLKEIARVQALILLDDHPVLKNAEVEQDIDLLKSSLNIMMSRINRFEPSALRPT